MRSRWPVRVQMMSPLRKPCTSPPRRYVFLHAALGLTHACNRSMWRGQALNTAEAPESTEEDAASALAAAKADFTRALELGNLTADASDGEKMTAAASYAGLSTFAGLLSFHSVYSQCVRACVRAVCVVCVQLQSASRWPKATWRQPSSWVRLSRRRTRHSATCLKSSAPCPCLSWPRALTVLRLCSVTTTCGYDLTWWACCVGAWRRQRATMWHPCVHSWNPTQTTCRFA